MREIVAEIVTIGDEILFGQITDTNSQWLSEQLGLIGIRVKRKISVGDELDELLTIFKESSSRADLILLTGGLGPTSDDITKPALCQHFACGLKMDEEVLTHVTQFFEKRNRPMLEVNKLQAAIPEKSQVLFNKMGTAPGLWLEQNGKVFIALPGVPFEMKDIMLTGGLPRLKSFFNPPVILHKIVRTTGIGESFLAEKMVDWEKQLPEHLKLAYLPSLGGVKLRLTGKGQDQLALHQEMDQQVKALQVFIEQHIYSLEDIELEEFIGRQLKLKKLQLALAESCTAGSIASLLTSIPGSSSYFLGGIVAYHNEVKKQQLGVSEHNLNTYGAVSEEVVKEMAENVRLKLGADIGLATSGIAGPDGGTPEKPVGTIWIGFSDKNKTIAKKLQLGSVRSINTKLTVTYALDLLRENIK